MMKKIILIIAVVLCATANAQQKELTLEDAVLARTKGLTPQNISKLQWVKGANNYVFLEENQYHIKTAANKHVSSFGIEKLASAYPSLKKLPHFISIGTTDLVFENHHQLVCFDYKNNKEQYSVAYDELANNKDYNGNQLAYTIDNNLFVATTTNPKMAVTNFADKNIVAGQAIHRYEFGITKGTFWSPKGNFLAFYQKDETHIANYPLVDVTTYPATLNNIKYPMAGQKSELAKIGVFNVQSSQTIYLEIDTKDEHYLTNLSWTPDEKYLLVAEVNRAQNHFFYNLYDVATGKKVKTLFEEQNNRWVEPEHDAVFLPKSTTDFLWMSERDGFMNLYLYNTSGTLKKQLTHFKYVIKSVLGFDKAGQNVLITTTGEDGRNTLVFSVNLKTGASKKITQQNGTHRVKLSDDGAYLIDDYSNLSTPREIAIINTKTAKSTTILKAENPLKTHRIGTTELITLTSKDGFNLYGRIIKPAQFDSTKKYPVLVYVYGGTHAQLVTNSWLGGANLWMNWLATQKEYIVFTIDNRGSANRGFAFESIIHRKAGEAAMEDQLTGVDYLNTLPFVDNNRIAVFGWSYGGFMSSNALFKGNDVFKAAIAVAPVTNWKWYDSIYTERYMRTRKENEKGYEQNSPINFVDLYKKGNYLLVHGVADDNVHFQHTAEMTNALIKSKKQFDTYFYPNRNHSIYGDNARIHLYTKMTNFLLQNL